jgi:hypothetical protein
MMKEPGYVCCFCGEEINAGHLDPCRLDLRTNRDLNEVQELACHAECLDKAIHREVTLLTQV